MCSEKPPSTWNGHRSERSGSRTAPATWPTTSTHTSARPDSANDRRPGVGDWCAARVNDGHHRATSRQVFVLTVCVMGEVGRRPTRVGVRELRQNLSVYLDRVKDGERLVVTEHGRPVAELTPLTTGAISVLERLVAEGRARAAAGNLADLGMPQPIDGIGVGDVSRALAAMRDEDAR